MAIRGSSLAGATVPVGGPAGLPGQSTYDAWRALGNTGSLADFMAAQKGAPGGVTTLAGKVGALGLADIGAQPASGDASGLTLKQTDEAGALPIPYLKKARSWAYFGDRMSISGNGTSDDTANAQNELAYAGANAIKLLIPDGMRIRTTAPLVLTGYNRIHGRGSQLLKNNSYQGPGPFTGFLFDHLGVGIQAASADGNTFDFCSLRDFMVMRNQPAPSVTAGVAWTPLASDFDIDFSQTSGELLGVEFLNATNGLRIRRNVGNQVVYDRIKGQFFKTGVQVLNSLDVVYGKMLHNWPYWSNNSNVLAYTLANCNTLHILRADGCKFDHVFGIYDNCTARLSYTDGGGVSGLAGKSNNCWIGVLNADNARQSLIVDAAAVQSTLSIAKLLMFQDVLGTAVNHGLIISAPNAGVTISNYESNNVRGAHAVVNASGARLNIGQFVMGTWNGYDYLNNATNRAPGLIASNGGTINIGGTWQLPDLATSQYTPYPLNATGAPLASGSVRGLLARGTTTVSTDASGSAFWAHSVGWAPTFTRINILSGGAGGAVFAKNTGQDGTNMSAVFYTATGTPVASRSDIKVEWEAWQGF